MSIRRLQTLCLAACLLLTGTGVATAYESTGDDWLAHYPTACQTLREAVLLANDCVLCHNVGSDSLNPYGWDLASLAVNFDVVAGLDSDGDGRTNGQEIDLDCTFPGNAQSVPEENPTWSAVKALYR